MDAEYWARIWKAKVQVRPKIDMAPRIWPGPNLIETDRPICCYCGKEILYYSDLTVEHLIPTSRGGNNSPANKRPCCYRCNSGRSNYSLAEWISDMRQKIAADNLPIEKENLLRARIEGALYWITYIESAGSKLYKSEEHYKNRRLLI